MKDFNKLTKGELAFRLDEVVRSLSADTSDFESQWLVNYDDGDTTVARAKETWDDVKDDDEFGLWEGLLKAFRYMVNNYGCEDGRTLTFNHYYNDGLYYEDYSNEEYDEDLVGGGFFVSADKISEAALAVKTNRIRETLEKMGYPLTETRPVKHKRGDKEILLGNEFEVDWRAVQTQKAAKWIKESIEWLKTADCGCCAIRLDEDMQLAVGWSDGYDPDDETVIHSKADPTFAINIGIKALEGDDMKTDFDWLTTPYVAGGDDEGEVFTSLIISPAPNDDLGKDFRYLMNEYHEIMKAYSVHEDGKCFPRK